MKMLDIKALYSRLIGIFKNRTNLFMALCALAVCFLVLSEIWPQKARENVTARDDAASQNEAAFLKETEEKLTEVLSNMDGVGEVKLMVTLESAGETIYAQTEKRETTQGQTGGEATNEKTVFQNDYVILDAGQNGQEALTTGVSQPTIQGVVVVCSGAGDITVVKNVTEAVCVALGISSNRVCVTKLN